MFGSAVKPSGWPNDKNGDAVERYVYDPYGNCAVYNTDWSATVAWADLVYSARGIVTAPRRMRACVGHAAPLS